MVHSIAAHEISLLILDTGNESIAPENPAVKVYTSLVQAQAGNNLFILTNDARLNEVSSFVHTAIRRRSLKGLLIREVVAPGWVTNLMDRAKLRTMKNTIVYSDVNVPKRILSAWAIGSQKHLIANAAVIEGRLLVLTCDMELLEIPFDSVNCLKSLSDKERTEFEVSPDGSYIHWTAKDVDIDLEGIRGVLDPARHAAADRRPLLHDQDFGLAVANIRRGARLRQGDISGLSDRNVRRIEAAFPVSADTVALLAQAHGMSADAYLNEIAKEIALMRSGGDKSGKRRRVRTERLKPT